MAQNDFSIANQGFPSFRSDLNDALQSLASNSSGTTAPPTTYAYQWWYDETNDILKIRNSANDAWVDFATFDQTTNSLSFASVTVDGDLTVDTDTLYVDSTNDRVGIGTSSPSEALEVSGGVKATSFVGDGAVPSGAVMSFAMNTAPTGWLKANGAAVSRTTYASLFAAIGTTFGAGDGSTTFELPDLRGEFVRGWDDGRGVDSGRSFGSAQLDQMQRITGAVGPYLRDTITTSDGALSNTLDEIFSRGGTTNRNFGVVTFDSADSPNARVSPTTSGETRPRNVALLACIKY